MALYGLIALLFTLLLSGCHALPSSSALEVRSNVCPDPTGFTSQFANHDNDGHGKYLGSCRAAGSGKNKCWTDQYIVSSYLHWKDWVDVSAGLDCAKQPSCSITHLDQHESCKTWSDDVSLEVGAEAQGISIGFSATYAEGGSDCITSSDQYTCTWTNKLCHKVVASNQIMVNRGYLRRSCNTPRHGEGPRSGDGKYTVGFRDWIEYIPTKKWRYSCQYHCSTNPGRRHLPEDTTPVNV